MDIAGDQTWTLNSFAALQNWVSSVEFVALDIVLIAGMMISWLALFIALVAVKKVKKQAASSYRLYEKIVHDLHIAGSGAIGMGQRIIALEKRINGQASIAFGEENPSRDYLSEKENHYPSSQSTTQRPNLQSVPKPNIEAESDKEEALPAMFSEKISLTSASHEVAGESNKKTDQSVKDIVEENTKKTILQQIEDPFELAKGLLQRGIAQAEVAKRCGLSLSETALMAMVLKNKNGAAASRLAG